ncbi:hypothetical protein HPP92_022199 [Vanilla planifolia]|uniref:VASt domain-containing protein n=1 Tax=Vanilla planifolia TaxID=51239 RepID=A0A835UH05_VANPL|nr:hypothetical protein HPP92_022199 [Vanilla planifolia]
MLSRFIVRMLSVVVLIFGTDLKKDLKSEVSIQDIENAVAEAERGSKRFAEEFSSSTRYSERDSNQVESTSLPDEKIDTSLLDQAELCENVRDDDEHLEGHLSLQSEDVDAPAVPECFTLVAQANFSVDLEEFFGLFISDQASNFVESFHKKCGDKDFQCTSWRRHEKFGYTRDVLFLHPVKVYLGAKYGRCQEVQKFRVYRNRHLVIETSQQISDVPYADYFVVEGIWIVQQSCDEENSCTVQVYSNVAFSKKTMFRGKIEQSTRDECREVYAIWIQNAHQVLKKKVAKQEDSSVHAVYRIQDSVVGSNSSKDREASEDLHQTLSLELQQSLSTAENHNPLSEYALEERINWTNYGSSVIRETWVTSVSYFKSKCHPSLAVGVFGLAAIVILMQICMIVLVTRVPEVHVITQASSFGVPIGYRAENIEWIEKRFEYLKEEMAMIESRLDSMRREHAILKMHLESLDQTKPKS